MKLFGGTSNLSLTKEVCSYLGIEPGKLTATTFSDGETQVEIHVVQGERSMATDNMSLGRFILDGIPPAPRGVPQIEVTFDIDADGILNVSAKDKATAREQSMQIVPSSGLSDSEVDQMIQDAEGRREEDQRKREYAEVRNNADTAVYSAEKFLGEFGEQISADDKKNLEEKTKAAREALSTEDTARIRQAATELGEAIQAVGAQMHQSAGPSTGPGTGPETGPPPEEAEGDVIEGEFSE